MANGITQINVDQNDFIHQLVGVTTNLVKINAINNVVHLDYIVETSVHIKYPIH